jgi:DNA replication and repair protein RecF
MIINIRLQHFRSYRDGFFDLSPGVTIIVGPNASGKTNLLEAVLVVARGSSYRARDNELVQFDSSWARLDAQTPAGARTIKIKKDPLQKVFEIDEQKLTRLHQSKTIPTVLFEPNHLLLMSGSPDLRRTFLDDLIEQSEAGFGHVRRHYKRVLAQRNSLLKKNPKDLREQLFVWNVRLSELGGQIAKRRQALIERLNERASELYSQLAGQEVRVLLHYVSRFHPERYESELLSKLEASTELDVLRGFTAYGPHRDDLEATIGGHSVQESASRGETRSLVLTLKLLEIQLLEDARGQRPILLLDDVFSELDKGRRQALTAYVESYQTFVTTTDADMFSKNFVRSAATIELPV